VAPFAAGAALIASAPWFWLGDLAASVAWQLGWIELAAAGLLYAARKRVPAAVLVLLAGLHSGPELTLWLPVRAHAGTHAATFTFASHNLLHRNRGRAEFETWLCEASPDVIVLSEVSLPWRRTLAELAADYPHQLYSPADDQWNAGTWGTAILSRAPFESTRLIELEDKGRRPPMEARVSVAGRLVTVRGVHALRPGGQNFQRRNATLNTLASEGWDPNCILAGDLNVTSTVPVFRELLAASGLCDSRRGFGRQPSYRTFRPLPLRVAIDHVLVGEAFEVMERRTEHVPGSDHLAVVTVLALAP
jgi:endonuclease/exonuclease/phosphatase (EEP) superfamily protein YafD